MQAQVTLINADEKVRFAEYVDEYVEGDMTPGEVFRAMRDEFGRCSGKIYRDHRVKTNDHGGERWEVQHIGWVFEARDRYGDGSGTYLREAWVTLLHDEPPVAPAQPFVIGVEYSGADPSVRSI